MLTIADICLGLIGPNVPIAAEVASRPVSGFVLDSRVVTAGNAFIATRGEKTDGHLFLQDAFERGAAVAIAEPRGLELGLPGTYVLSDGSLTSVAAPHGEQSTGALVFIVPDSLAGIQRLATYWHGQVPAQAIGITGSIGKTTTKETVANVLEQRFVTFRSEGNLNNEWGLPITLLGLEPKHERVVLEMGMYALGEIARLCEVAHPRIGVVTNVGPTHLERLGSIERIAQAKSELVRSLPRADAGGFAILNADDPFVRAMADHTEAQVFMYGLSQDSDLWADEITSEGLEGIQFRVHYRSESFYLRLPMLGRHSVHTALRGAAVGLVEGLSWAEIIAGLHVVQGQLRLMVVPGPRDTTLIDDTYNASPDSMLAALNLLAEIVRNGKPENKRRSIAVLGDMLELGSYEEQGHRLVGGRAAQVADKLVTVGVRAHWIADEALASGMQPADVHPAEDNAGAVTILQGMIRPGDVILVKGSRALSMESIVDALSHARSRES